MLLKSFIKNFLPAGRKPRTILRGPAKGIRLELDFSRDTQVWLGRYEAEVMRWVVKHTPRNGLCVDVGASEGLFTLLLARAVDQAGKVISIDPNAAQLRRNVALNESNRNGEIVIVEGLAGDGSHGTHCLSTLITGTDRKLAMLKVDVDGAELAVLQGMKDVLARDRPPIALELHSRELQTNCMALLEPLGYRFQIIQPPQHEFRPIEFNVHLFALA